MLKLIPAQKVPFNSVIGYCNSFDVCDSYENYILFLSTISEYAYRDALKTAKENNSYMYFLVDEDNITYPLGVGFIDNILANYHSPIFDTGCISFSIRPDERNKGYASELLSLMIDKCGNFGLKEACISCYESNIASKNVIEKNGGVLEKTFVYSNGPALKYWIQIERKKDKVKCKTLNCIGKRKSNC